MNRYKYFSSKTKDVELAAAKSLYNKFADWTNCEDYKGSGKVAGIDKDLKIFLDKVCKLVSDRAQGKVYF